MYQPRTPNVRMKIDERPGRPSEPLPRTGARVSYRNSTNSDLGETALTTNSPLESRTKQDSFGQPRRFGTLKLPDEN